MSGRQDPIEMMFVDRDAACIQLGDALAIDIRANHVVPRLGETSPGDETHVPTTDD